MYNNLGNESTTLHFHGIHQNGTNNMDGVSMVTQCPVPPGHSYVYNFTITQNGTYWYHSHVAGQYPDGNRGPLIVHNKDAYFNSLYQEEMVITMTDWYNTVMKILDKEFLSPYDPEGNEPIPDSMLVNETMASKWSVEPNTTYLVRLINIGSFVSHYFYIEGHNFTIVEVDGVYTEPATTDMLYIAVGQRYSVLLTTKDSTDENYAVVNIFDSTQLAIIPSTLALNQTNWLEYNPSAPFPNATITVDSSSDLVAFDDFTLVPYDHHPLLEPNSYVTVDSLAITPQNGVN